MNGLLIIGYGNPLRGDDGFGFFAAERLRENLPEAEVLAVHQLTPELIEPVSRATRVIFIDASAQGEPGKLMRREVSPSGVGAAFSHHASPEGLLAGAQAVYGTAPAGVLYTVVGESFEFGEGLSPSVERALDDLFRNLPIW